MAEEIQPPERPHPESGPGEDESRSVGRSRSLLVRWMSIADANSAGFVHGGTVMRLVDEAAGLAAIKHSGRRVVTAGMDRMTFLTLLDIEADRREVGLVHAGVHREDQPTAPARNILGQAVEAAIGVAIGVAPECPNVGPRRIEGADRERRIAMPGGDAGGIGRRRARGREASEKRRGENRNSALDDMLRKSHKTTHGGAHARAI